VFDNALRLGGAPMAATVAAVPQGPRRGGRGVGGDTPPSIPHTGRGIARGCGPYVDARFRCECPRQWQSRGSWRDL